MKTPHALLGYELEAEKNKTRSPNISNPPSLHTYIHMKITVEPKIPKLTPNMVTDKVLLFFSIVYHNFFRKN